MILPSGSFLQSGVVDVPQLAQVDPAWIPSHSSLEPPDALLLRLRLLALDLDSTASEYDGELSLVLFSLRRCFNALGRGTVGIAQDCQHK